MKFFITVTERATYTQTGTYIVEAANEEEARRRVLSPISHDDDDIDHAGDNEIDYNSEQLEPGSREIEDVTAEVVLDGLPEGAAVAPGDHLMTLEAFYGACKAGGFTDYDGFGLLSDGKRHMRYEPGSVVTPSNFLRLYPQGHYTGWTHIVWYNR